MAALLVVTLAAGCTRLGPGEGDRPAAPTPPAGAAATMAPREPTEAPAVPQPTGDPTMPEFAEPELVGSFDAEIIPGASGLAASRRNPGVRYVIDDRSGTSEVWVLRADATIRGAIPVEGLDARDPEALAVAPCGAADDRWCVYLGDIGDNLRSREDVRVYRFAEPDLAEGLPTDPVEADVAVLTYPDGAEDSEALLVDGEGVPHLVSKAPYDTDRGQTGRTWLYAASGFADGELRAVGELDLPPPHEPLLSLAVGDVVTGGSLGPDGRVLLRTYDQVLLATPPSRATGLDSLPDWGFEPAPSPWLPQPEATTWVADGCGYDLASERVGELWRVPCVRE